MTALLRWGIILHAADGEADFRKRYTMDKDVADRYLKKIQTLSVSKPQFHLRIAKAAEIEFSTEENCCFQNSSEKLLSSLIGSILHIALVLWCVLVNTITFINK